MSVRLNKLLSSRGIGARRKCDDLIASGVVRVNGQVVTEPGTRVEPDRDRVEVEGRPLPRAAPFKTYVLNKPVGVITTLHDPEGRRTVRDLMPPGSRLFPVGRLDADTSGLLLLTNDGELAHHLMHPRYGVSKRYRVHLEAAPSEAALAKLRDGVEFEPGVVSAPAQVWLRDSSGGEAVLELALHEGRHRQVRHMCEAVGLTVHRLHRWGYGPLRLGQLERGMWRELSEREVEELRAASARPRARTGGVTGRRTFDGPAVRPRRRETGPRRAVATGRPERAARPAAERERIAGPRSAARPERGRPERFGAGARPERGRPERFKAGPRPERGRPERFGMGARPERGPASRSEREGDRRERFGPPARGERERPRRDSRGAPPGPGAGFGPRSARRSGPGGRDGFRGRPAAARGPANRGRSERPAREGPGGERGSRGPARGAFRPARAPGGSSGRSRGGPPAKRGRSGRGAGPGKRSGRRSTRP